MKTFQEIMNRYATWHYHEKQKSAELSLYDFAKQQKLSFKELQIIIDKITEHQYNSKREVINLFYGLIEVNDFIKLQNERRRELVGLWKKTEK